MTKKNETQETEQEQETIKDSASMVAPHPLKEKPKNEEKKTNPPKGSGGLMPVEELAEKAGIKTWEVAGLMRAAGWAPGKQVTKEDFDQTLDRFRKRPQGGGKI